MGNKLCKKKSDAVDNPKSQTQFDRIINRLHLRPSGWKSDSHLNQKQINNRYSSSRKDENITHVQPLSKSSDWTDVPLEVEKDEPIHLRNPKLSLLFDNEKNTPTPPPRKHKKGFREKLEAVAKNGLQAFQSKKPIEEPLCVKKVINYVCPVCDKDCTIHNRNHKHESKKNEINEKKNEEIRAKRRKNLSVVSLPNYSELKLSLAHFEDIDTKPDGKTSASNISLQGDSKKLSTCMTRCRSFGSILPQQLLDRLRTRKIPIDIESDDSFGALEDWDLRIIEHYNPKDTSLPRPRKIQKSNKPNLSDIESLIVKDEDLETEKPKAPARRAESLIKKINREAAESSIRRSQEMLNSNLSITPPPSPESRNQDWGLPLIEAEELPTRENGEVEHSSLLKILEDFSVKDKQKNRELRENINLVEKFLSSEKSNTHIDLKNASEKIKT